MNKRAKLYLAIKLVLLAGLLFSLKLCLENEWVTQIDIAKAFIKQRR